jgi:hypothetical protein
MWGATLSRPLMIVGLVGRYPTNYLIIRTPIFYHRSFYLKPMQVRGLMRDYLQFPKAIPQ